MNSQNNPTILMYHGVVSDETVIPPQREEGAGLYDLPLDFFQDQMGLLKDSGKNVGTFWGNSDEKIDVILTFDDGEKNNFSQAFPVLQKYGFLAYMFITPERVEKQGYMTWEELMELRDAGIIIGSHGLTHQMLVSLKDSELEQELTASKDLLEQYLKIEIKDLSIPRGFYDERVIKYAKQVGYEHIFVSEKKSPADPVWERTAIKGDWSISRFEQALKGQVPLNEKMFNGVKNGVKGILGGEGYNKFRGLLLRGKK